MAKPGETYNKKEKEKKRIKQRQEKQEKMEQRKANAKKGQSLDDMMAYIDEEGNISSTPPDPRKMKSFKQEDMQISVPKYEPSNEPAVRAGVVAFFDESKGFGFINDKATGERAFVHINNLNFQIRENDQVSYEVEHGPKGLVAVNVQKA
ncbi:MAG TPA: cold shock domain-containing protein [Chitinophagaceae bacterium]|nr:cold shock domain-containing protein [Chitinophagaceae bacterium]